MSKSMIQFPSFPTTEHHRLFHGGEEMKIKNTHPIYPDPAQRLARILEAKRCCQRQLAAVGKSGAGKLA